MGARGRGHLLGSHVLGPHRNGADPQLRALLAHQTVGMSTRWVTVCYQVYLDLGWSLVVTNLDSGIGLSALLTGGTGQSSVGGAFTAISKSEASLKVQGQSSIMIREDHPGQQ